MENVVSLWAVVRILGDSWPQTALYVVIETVAARTSMGVRLGAVLFLAMSLARGWGQIAPEPPLPVAPPALDQSQPITTLRTAARLVSLDVVVEDGHGHPVTGLKAADFGLAEDGVAQTIASFTEQDTRVFGSPAGPALPPNTFAVQVPVRGDGTLTVIVLGNLDVTDTPYVGRQLRDYLRMTAVVEPMAIVRMDSHGFHLVQGFTVDRNALLEAATSRRILASNITPPVDGFRRGTFQLRQFLRGIAGRVNLIWFSAEGQRAADGSFPDVSRFVQDMDGGTDVLQLSRVALYTVNAAGLEVQSMGQDGSLGPMGASFGRGNIRFALENMGLTEMAERTGGKNFGDTNGFKEAIAEVVETGSHFYTITYRPTNRDWNGAYRRIHVTVKGYDLGPESFWSKALGLTRVEKVLYRRGYYARDRFPVRRTQAVDGSSGVQRKLISVSPRGRPAPSLASLPPIQAAMRFGTPAPDKIHFTLGVTPDAAVEKTPKGASPSGDVFLSPPFQGGAYRFFRIHYRIEPSDLRFVKGSDGLYSEDLRFVAVVFRDDGLEASSITYVARLRLDTTEYARVKGTPFSYDQTIAVPVKGNFFLRTAVHELGSDKIGAIEIPVEWIH